VEPEPKRQFFQYLVHSLQENGLLQTSSTDGKRVHSEGVYLLESELTRYQEPTQKCWIPEIYFIHPNDQNTAVRLFYKIRAEAFEISPEN